MNYDEFCEWLKAENIELSFATIGNSGVNGVMQFCKSGEYLVGASHNAETDFIEVKESIIATMEDINPQSLEDIVTVTEVAELLGKDTSTIRKAIDKAIIDGILIVGKDCRKAKQIWLLRKIAVKKMYNDITWKQIDSIKNPDKSGIL